MEPGMIEELVKNTFMFCVYVLQVIGGAPGEFGFGYYLANLLIFVVLQPALILLFFCLWRRERTKNRRLTDELALSSSV